MKVIDRVSRRTNDMFKYKLADAVFKQFQISIETSYSIFQLAYVTVRADGQEFTPEQMAFMQAYEKGYFDCKREAQLYDKPVRTG